MTTKDFIGDHHDLFFLKHGLFYSFLCCSSSSRPKTRILWRTVKKKSLSVWTFILRPMMLLCSSKSSNSERKESESGFGSLWVTHQTFFTSFSKFVCLCFLDSPKDTHTQNKQKMSENPKLFVDGVDPSDVNQGESSNCWFVAVSLWWQQRRGCSHELSLIGSTWDAPTTLRFRLRQQLMLFFVVVLFCFVFCEISNFFFLKFGNDIGKNLAVYRFRFWRFGQWVEVVWVLTIWSMGWSCVSFDRHKTWT